MIFCIGKSKVGSDKEYCRIARTTNAVVTSVCMLQANNPVDKNIDWIIFLAESRWIFLMIL